LLPIHAAQLLTYLKLNDLKLGYLITGTCADFWTAFIGYVNSL